MPVPTSMYSDVETLYDNSDPFALPTISMPDISELSIPSDPASTASAGMKLPTAAQGLQAVSSILGGVGDFMQGEESAKADIYNANLAITQGQFEVEQIGEQEEGTLSTQKAMYAKAGVEMSGSPLDTALQTATQYEYSKQVTTYNAESTANMDRYEAAVAKQQGEFGLASGIIGAGVDIGLALL